VVTVDRTDAILADLFRMPTVTIRGNDDIDREIAEQHAIIDVDRPTIVGTADASQGRNAHGRTMPPNAARGTAILGHLFD
jgi:hypothetical protein